MKREKWKRLFFGCSASLMILFFSLPVNAAEIVKAEIPAVITSLGQSPDAYCVSVLAKKAQIPLEFEKLITANDIVKYKTIFICVGASLKGFGSAGVNLDSESARGRELVKEAKKNNQCVVVVHTGGVGRREEMTNKLLDVVAKDADYLLVYKEGDKDNYFSKLASEKNIPLKLMDKVFQVQDVFKEMFEI